VAAAGNDKVKAAGYRVPFLSAADIADGGCRNHANLPALLIGVATS
jgi:hypothetical protein